MPINSTHPEYDRKIGDWSLVRDTVEGESRIKDMGQVYLPAPPGSLVLNQPAQISPDGASAMTSRYAFYKSFAKFPEIVAPALNGLQGVIQFKDPEIKLPPKMEYLREEATPDGRTLISLWEDITREILQTGRLGLLVELFGDQPVLCRYAAETIINWRVRPKRFGGTPEFLVLKEKVWKDDRDEFAPEMVWRFRILRFDGLTYTVQAFDHIEDKFVPVELEGADGNGVVTPVLLGKPFGFMPWTNVNAVTEGFNMGPIPFLPLSRRAINIYQKSATFERSLYIKGDPTVVITGIDPDKAPNMIGGGTLWAFPEPDAKATMLDIDGQGIPLQREAIKDEYEYFYQEGGRLLDTRDRPVESGEALKHRQTGHNVSLVSIATNAAWGMQQALRQIGMLLGITDLKEITFSANIDFTLPSMSGKEVLEFTTAKNQGAPLSNATLHEMMKRRNVTTKTFEEEMDAMQDEGDDLGTLGRDESSGTGSEGPPSEGDQDEAGNNAA